MIGRPARVTAAGAALLFVTALVLGAAFLCSTSGDAAVERARAIDTSRQVVDRAGSLLRPFPLPDGRWRLPVRLEEVDPRFVDMLLAYEDARFYTHFGIDPLAVLRASWQFAQQGRIVSGASTLTMQVARLLSPRSERTLWGKLVQMRDAVRLEIAFSKQEILELYLTLAPYGGNIEG